MSLTSEKRIITVNYPKFNFNTENPFKEELDKIVDTGFAEATTTRTIKNITETLTKGLRSKYNIPAKDIKQKVHEILKLHGLAPENFDPISIISTLTFTDKPINDISVDDNANKTEINMEGICCEAFLAYKKAVGYDYLYQTIKELYGKEEAKKCSADMYDFSIALNDSTNILKAYCFCIDASKLVMIGRNFGQVHSAPAKYIRTYIATLGDTIREMSFNIAGAIAVGSFFLDIAHLAIYKERITLEDLKTDKKIRKNVINSLQQFIYTVNHYSRNAVECVTEDTEILTPTGFKKYNEVNVNDDIYTWNDGNLEIQKIQAVSVKDFDGNMCQFRGRDIVQTVTPNHRVLFKTGSNSFNVKNAMELMNNKSPIGIPISIKNNIEDYPISDELIKLLSIVMCDGYLKKSGESNYLILINKSKKRWGHEEIINSCKKLGYNLSQREFIANFNHLHIKEYDSVEMIEYSLSVEDSRDIVNILNGNRHKIPDVLYKFSQRQLRLFLYVWANFDGNWGEKIKLQCDSEEIQDAIQHLAFLAGYGSRKTERWIGNNKSPTLYVFLYKKETKFANIKEFVYYKGKVWCPTTKNGIVIYRKEGKIFISGNSPFVNVSLFDRKKLISLIDDSNYGWYFPKKASIIEDNNIEDDKQKYLDFVLDYIEELQEMYLSVFDRGDPLRNGLQFPFPVSTVNLAITINEDGSREITDKNNRLLNYLTKSCDISRYNIYCSEGTKVASCCFSGDEKIRIFNNDSLIFISLKEAIETYGNGLTNFYIEAIDQDCSVKMVPITGVLAKKSEFDYLIEIIIDEKHRIKVTPDHLVRIITDDNIKEVESRILIELLNNNKVQIQIVDYETGEVEWRNIKKIENISYNGLVYDLELKEINYFAANGIVSHNCRLLSDADMMGMASGVNSFGGSQISLGSHRVATINLARIAYEAKSYDDFRSILSDRVEETGKILKAHKILIMNLEKLGKQPWITNGWINMSHMFSTFGCIGYVEAADILKEKFNNNDFDYMKDFLVYFNNECKRVAAEEKIIFNIEAIPGEGMAPKLAKSDQIIVDGKYDILANQWVSLWGDYTIYEKMKRDGEIQKLMTGGSIVHINVDSKLTATQADTLIKDSIKYGMAHFALNAVYTECVDCHKVHKGNYKNCPSCNSEKLFHYTRVIGYFSKVENWNETRRKKDFPSRKFLDANGIKAQLGQ
jgi:anaerobic ribonucleoside-triphosphate reductase